MAPFQVQAFQGKACNRTATLFPSKRNTPKGTRNYDYLVLVNRLKQLLAYLGSKKMDWEMIVTIIAF